MALHHPACNDLGSHIQRERESADLTDISLFLRLAVFDYDREHGVEPIDPIDAAKRMEDLGWAPGEYVEAYGR